jgi:ribosomal protein S17E
VHDTNGKYLCYSKANQKIRDKYNNTIEWTFINDDENEKHLSNRLLIYSKLIDHLNNISRYSTRLMRFINLTGILQPKIDFHIEEIKKITTAGRYILLIKSIIDSSSIINQSSRQPYSFNDFI